MDTPSSVFAAVGSLWGFLAETLILIRLPANWWTTESVVYSGKTSKLSRKWSYMWHQLGDALKGDRKDTSFVPCSSAPALSYMYGSIYMLGISLVFRQVGLAAQLSVRERPPSAVARSQAAGGGICPGVPGSGTHRDAQQLRSGVRQSSPIFWTREAVVNTQTFSWDNLPPPSFFHNQAVFRKSSLWSGLSLGELFTKGKVSLAPPWECFFFQFQNPMAAFWGVTTIEFGPQGRSGCFRVWASRPGSASALVSRAWRTNVQCGLDTRYMYIVSSACSWHLRPLHTKRQRQLMAMFTSILGVMQCQRWVCTNPLLLPMDDTGHITLDQRYTDADVWCEWAFIQEIHSVVCQPKG